MKIEAGKFYKTRDGQMVGPMERASGLTEWPWCADEWDDYCRDNGTVSAMGKNDEMPGDLIEEWVEPTATPAQTGPVRMVRQIVPGDYGKVRIHPSPMRPVELMNVFAFSNEDDSLEGKKIRASELRSAAMVLSQLAEALDDQP